MKFISVRGAAEHNLKDLSVDIPKNKLVAFTGVSGSGKSSLVFDTIYAEAFRRFADASAVPLFMMGNAYWARMSRPRYRAITGLPPALGLSQRQGVAGKLSTVGTISSASDLLRVYFAAFGDVFCRTCDIPLRPLPFAQLVERVFQDYAGRKVAFIASVAEKRKGAFEKEVERFRQLGFSKIRVNEKIYNLQDEEERIQIDARRLNTVEVFVDALVINTEKRKRIERAVEQTLEHGRGLVVVEDLSTQELRKFNTKASCPQCGESAPRLDPRYFSHSSQGQCEKCSGTGASGPDLPSDLFPCGTCHGTRLSPKRPIVRVGGKKFESLHQCAVSELDSFVRTDLATLSQGDKAKERVANELSRLVRTMHGLGLGHLPLNRSGDSLSPGDLQRLRLAAMLSNRLSGALYVLDEPCQGLTAGEVQKLVTILRNIVRDGSSVLVVEHHPVFLSEVDNVFVMGPGAGVHGGHVVSTTSGKDYLLHEAAENKGHKAPTFPKVTDSIVFQDINIRNLSKKKITLPQQAITIVRGDAGRGKSSFLELCVVPVLKEIGKIEDEVSVGKSFCSFQISAGISVTHVNDVRPGTMTRASRRSVAAALEVIQPIREILAKLPMSQVMGLTESHFSWHSKLGKCETCEGRGYVELPQRFGPPVQMECELCLGAKLNSRSLLPRFKGYNMADLMNLGIEEARAVFAHVKSIEVKLARAVQFGLGYVKLGQGMDSLSGGELQRLTLTMELKRATLAGAWFVLVHPGTGLHAPDIQVLGDLMSLMVTRGATFVVLENREEFLKYAGNLIEF